MRSLRFAPVFALLALCLTTPAMADLTFTFTSGATFTDSGDVDCGGFSTSTTSFTCTPYTLSGYDSQTLTLGQTAYYYLGSVQDAEFGDDIGGNEDDPGTLVITFDTSVTTPFTLTIPVTFSASANTATFNATGVSQLINAGSEGGFLFAQVRLSSTTPPDTTPDAGSPVYENPNLFVYNIGTANSTEYYYLQLTYNTPEPATYVLIGSALLGLAFLKKRRRA